MNDRPAPETASADEAPPARRTRWLLWGGLAVVAIAVAIGLWLASRPAAPPLQGEVEAEEVNVATKALSRLSRIMVSEGDRVRRGEVLAILNAPEVESGAQQADAALESARALQEIADQGAREQDIAALRANWEAAKATANLAATTSRRVDSLYQQGVVAAQRRDEARAAMVSSARIAEAARLQYEKVAAGTRKENKEVAAAQVRSAQALVSAATAMQRETQLVSPIDGEVSRRLVQPGEIVSPILPAIQLIAIDRPWVTVNIQEDDFKGMTQGRVLRGSIPALGQTVDFRVTNIAPQGSYATFRATRQSSGYDVHAFAVKLEPTQRVKGLRPGMSVLFDWPQ
ncbi:efflux RND transporter periplasmic adaptor subunit [Sphingomonas sp.]|jgi:HlyD family secretion protein|uniref:HlyD family secretion protein n=1 Tax=Sphingomonas sp. TaxID=28214 RepID=UPI0026048CA5|nr:efflux RND transporter periplasmic adaptor subunit [Sphingomonas sp.]MDF2493399.1 HlyD family secretion protein [Sphingomonas sp.]